MMMRLMGRMGRMVLLVLVLLAAPVFGQLSRPGEVGSSTGTTTNGWYIGGTLYVFTNTTAAGTDLGVNLGTTSLYWFTENAEGAIAPTVEIGGDWNYYYASGTVQRVSPTSAVTDVIMHVPNTNRWGEGTVIMDMGATLHSITWNTNTTSFGEDGEADAPTLTSNMTYVFEFTTLEDFNRVAKWWGR